MDETDKREIPVGTTYPDGLLKQSVQRQLAGSTPEWTRLKKNVSLLKKRVAQDGGMQPPLNLKKTLLPRRLKRRLQRLRNGHRKSYQQGYKEILRSGREQFQNRRIILDNLQKTRRTMWGQQIKTFKVVHGLLKRLTTQLLAARKQLRG